MNLALTNSILWYLNDFFSRVDMDVNRKIDNIKKLKNKIRNIRMLMDEKEKYNDIVYYDFSKFRNINDNKYYKITEYKADSIIQNNIPCWILTNPRSGSTFLGNTMTELGLAFEGYEFKENLAHYITRGRKEKSDDFVFPPTSKVHRKIFERFLKDDDIDIILNRLVGIKFIYLIRKDCYSKAVSNFFYNDKKHCREIKQYNEKLLMKIYYNCVNENSNWDVFLEKLNIGEDFITVYFEDLISNPIREIKRILEFLKINISDIDIDSSIKRHIPENTGRSFMETEEYIKRLKQAIIKRDGFFVSQSLTR